MKRFLLCLLIFISLPIVAFSAENYYQDYLNCFDLTFVDELSDDTSDYLESLGLADFDYQSITNLSIENILKVIQNIFKLKINDSVKTASIVLIFVLLSALFKSLSDDASSLSALFSTISAVAIAIVLLSKIGVVIDESVSSLSVASNFIFAFIPTFCAIIAVGGGAATSLSTNTSLLLLSQGLSFVSSNVFTPIINSFLAISVCSSIRSEINLSSFLSTVKRIITSAISFISAMFVSILSIKTSVSARSDILGIRSVRFVINTIVPVIGSSISEGLLSIQSYSSLIKSSVGIIGIISVSLVFIPSIIDVVIWRMTLSICSIASDLFCDNSVSSLLNAFKDTLLLINVVLILSLVTTIISIGILIASRTT